MVVPFHVGMAWLGQGSVLMMAPRHTIAVYMYVVECREDAEVVVGGRAASEHTLGWGLTCAAVKFPQANHGNIGPNSVTHQRTGLRYNDELCTKRPLSRTLPT